MNYVVGNTSGLAVGNIPTEIDRRIGDQSQIGGSLMEVQIYNPATFSVERQDIINVLNQLDIDITLHSDPNTGFASAYRTRGQQAVGFDVAHRYFTRYLNQLAIFKSEVENRGDVDFNIGRINPHASTSGFPPLEERMEADVGLDPFGFNMNDLSDEAMNDRDSQARNIYRNPEFLRKLYHTLFLKESNYPFDQYPTFAAYSEKFDKAWRKSRHIAANQVLEDEVKGLDQIERLEAKAGAIQTARMRSQGIGSAWLQIQENTKLDKPLDTQALPIGEEIETLADAKSIIALMDLPGFNLQRLSESIYTIASSDGDDLPDDFVDSNPDWQEILLDALEEAVDTLWNGKPEKGENFMAIDAKQEGLSSHLEVQGIRIYERAYDIGRSDYELEEQAEKVFMGEKDFFENGDSGRKPPEVRHRDMIQRLLQSQQFQRQLWMESTIFYQIMPAWMSSASESNENHEGWTAPEFIWETIVENRWGEVDLADPNGDKGYFEMLAENREFQMDVAAAASACYVWAHFTQIESDFEIKNEPHVDDTEFHGTWVEWMNMHGIGVNIETMHGSPQQLLKLWRPKDIAVAVRAINMTADSIVGGSYHDELDDAVAKMTIDMEHIASFGVDPWKEMELLIGQEKDLAGGNSYGLNIDSERPLADILRQYHLMDVGLEAQQGTLHGPFRRGNVMIYEWLYNLVDAGFARNPGEPAAIMFEQGEQKAETLYTTRIAMDMIQLGITPDDLDPSAVPVDGRYENEREALMARFFGMDKSSVDMEWAKIEEHAFDPLKGLLESEEFDHTWSGRAALDRDNRPDEWMGEEYR